MKKYISSDFDAVINLLEILHINHGNNPYIERLQDEAYKELKKILSEVTNIQWTINLLLRLTKEKL